MCVWCIRYRTSSFFVVAITSMYSQSYLPNDSDYIVEKQVRHLSNDAIINVHEYGAL
jgi:hypothetical protein